MDNLYYSNVKITIGSIESVGAYTGAELPYDTYLPAQNRLSIPIVDVGNTRYYNVVITVGQVLSVGGSCTTQAACSTSDTSSTLYYTPAPYSTAVQTSYSGGTMSSATSFVARNRYLISDSAAQTSTANYMQVGLDYNAATGYSLDVGALSTNTTYNTYLQKMVQVASDSYGYFRLDSQLHPNNAIDYDAADGNRLKFRNNFGKANATYGYVTFAYDAGTKLLQAKKRYKYSYIGAAATTGVTAYTQSYAEDTAFTAANYYVKLSNGQYTLVASASSATPLYLYNTPLDLGIPSFLNPANIAFVTNDAAPFFSKVTVASVEGTSGSIYKQVNATYRSQVASSGSNEATKKSADDMLAKIKAAVEANGEKLRYSTALYTAYRDATLSRKLVSDSVSDGAPGQNLVPYVYFTNEKDTSGKYHPFMVVVNYGNQASPNGLKDVPHPPGYGTGSYPTSKVTRFSNLENYVLAIPMKDYGQVTAVTDNVFTSNLWTERTNTAITADVYTYADKADNGLLIDGAVIFPTYNNSLIPSHLAGELSASGCHVGQGGGGPHCHSDGYQAGFGLGLYNDADYLNKTHPPLIGFGYDGISLFGQYRTSDSAMLGYGTALDAFGGHNHDGIGYHYHAHVVLNHKPPLMSSTTQLNVLMKGAYIGNTNNIPYFRTNASFKDNKYLGGSTN